MSETGPTRRYHTPQSSGKRYFVKQMRVFSQVFALLFVPILLGGCRYKGWESFTSATTIHPTPGAKGDPYSFGSEAGANGGLKPQTNYGAGANIASAGKLNVQLDQPEKGNGQERGQYPNVAAPGFGQENGPALQPQPSAVGNEGAPLRHG